MAIPPELSEVEPIVIDGIGGGQTGRYFSPLGTGTFRRSDSRLAFGDVIENRRGSLTVRLDAVGGPSRTVTCTAQERTVILSVLDVPLEPMTLGCRIDGGETVLELGATPRRLDGREERRGVVMLGAVRLDIHSVHRFEGTPLASDTPVGYVLRNGDRAVGAVDLNGAPRVFLSPDLSEPERDAASLAATILSLFWDPADSPLGE